MKLHYGDSACEAEGLVYPNCLCTAEGRAAWDAMVEATWQRMFGPGGTQR